MNLSPKSIETLELAAMLHDIGKIGINSSVLNKDGALSDEEYKMIKRHPQMGYEIIRDIQYLKTASNIVLQHHERWDGRGYPTGIKGNEISIEARIISVVDAYDAMTTNRPYRKQPLSKFDAIEELNQGCETQFDKDVVNIFVEMLQKQEVIIE